MDGREHTPLHPDSRIGTVVLQVGALDRSLAFYRDVIGFCVLDRAETPARTARLGVGGSSRVWLELRERPGARRVPPRGLVGLYHFAVLLPSRGALGRFFIHAVNAGAEVASANHLVSEALYLVDPDGLTIEVYRDVPRHDWRYAGNELQMASLPLDADGLVAATDEAPRWDGLPAGTTMGHMHFYVGDLSRAETFYVHGLGFAPTLRSFPGALFVSAGGYHHHVGLNTWASHMPVVTDEDAKLVSWELVVPDAAALSALTRRLESAGVPVARDDGRLTASDPWGITIVATHP